MDHRRVAACRYEWTGIGGATEYDNIEVEEAVSILIEFGADELNPTR